MSSVFVIQNQAGQFLSRQKEWVEKSEIGALFKTPHRDLAINELFEVTSKDTEVRAKVVGAESSAKGLPLVADLPPLEFPKIALPEDMAVLDKAGVSETDLASESVATETKTESEQPAEARSEKRPFPQLKPLAQPEQTIEE